MWKPRDRERYIGSYDPEHEMPDPDRNAGDRWQSDAYRHGARDGRFAYRLNPDRFERDFDRESGGGPRWSGDGRDYNRSYDRGHDDNDRSFGGRDFGNRDFNNRDFNNYGDRSFNDRFSGGGYDRSGYGFGGSDRGGWDRDRDRNIDRGSSMDRAGMDRGNYGGGSGDFNRSYGNDRGGYGSSDRGWDRDREYRGSSDYDRGGFMIPNDRDHNYGSDRGWDRDRQSSRDDWNRGGSSNSDRDWRRR
jgi:hypothetical protein